MINKLPPTPWQSTINYLLTIRVYCNTIYP